MWGDIAIAFLLAFVTAFVITPYTMRFAHKVGAIDIPEDRRVNKKPMPRLGGIAIILGFLVSMIYLVITMSIEGKINFNGEENYSVKLLGFLLAGVVLAIFCLIDDIKGLTPMVKLLGQVIAATIAFFCGIRIDNINIPFVENTVVMSNIVSYIISLGWMVGITNAINLIDGLDGLSSGISLISCISLIIIFSLNDSPLIAVIMITALAGAISGFLPFNFNPARTFMGDTGAQFLGFSLSIISILGIAKTYTLLVLVTPIIVLALPIFDTIFAIFRRIIKGKSLKAVVMPDKGHLHHKLMKKGYTQKQAVFILYGISAALGMFAIILLDSGIWKAMSFAFIIIAVIAIGYNDMTKSSKNKEKEDTKTKEQK